MPKVTTAGMAVLRAKETPANPGSISVSPICSTPRANVCPCPLQAPPPVLAAGERAAGTETAGSLKHEDPGGTHRLRRMSKQLGVHDGQDPGKAGQQGERLWDRAAGIATTEHSRPRGHCLPADPATLHRPLEIQSQAWRVSLARPESGPSGWLPRGREGALPAPGSVARGGPCLSPAASSAPSSQDAVWAGGSGNRK